MSAKLWLEDSLLPTDGAYRGLSWSEERFEPREKDSVGVRGRALVSSQCFGTEPSSSLTPMRGRVGPLVGVENNSTVGAFVSSVLSGGAYEIREQGTTVN